MKSRPKIVIDADIPFIHGVLESYADAVYIRGDKISASDLLLADALITRTRTRCNQALLESSSIKLIATATIGYDHIDMAYCTQKGIKVITSAGCNARGVLQYVMGALAHLSIRQKWQPSAKTLGIIGVGNVGSLVSEYGRLLGFKILCCDPPRQAKDSSLNYISLRELLPQCDIITLHVPFIPKRSEGEQIDLPKVGTIEGKSFDVEMPPTEGMASEEFFELMRQGAIFINSSRGGVMEDNALIKAIESQKISAAVIDTWNGEPEINRNLLTLATLATPHIAGYSMQGKAAATAAVVQAVSQEFGLPLNTWYPTEVQKSVPNNRITWEEVKTQMPNFFDITQQSETLKNRAEIFETLRNNYTFRTEFF